MREFVYWFGSGWMFGGQHPALEPVKDVLGACDRTPG